MQSLFVNGNIGIQNTIIGNKQLHQANVSLPNVLSSNMQMSLSQFKSQATAIRSTDRSSYVQMSFGLPSSSMILSGSILKSKLNLPSSRFQGIQPQQMTLGSKTSSSIGKNMSKKGPHASTVQNVNFLNKMNSYIFGSVPTSNSKFSKRSTVILSATILAPVQEQIINKNYFDPLSIQMKEVIQKPLPYPMNGLDPVIIEPLLKSHYGSRHQTCVKNINDFQKLAVEAQANGDHQKFENISLAIKKNTANHLNYEFFWESLAPNGISEKGGMWPYPNSGLQHSMNNSFGSLKKFQDNFNSRAAAAQDLDQVWLVFNTSSGKSLITTTADQETLFNDKFELVPLMAIRVLAHAGSEFDKSEYMKKIWKVVNWTKVCERFDNVQA